ncbi:urocortin-2-like isoform X3 [Myotis daubentonii]|uniref:urocortin-2-like isoform X3 n=1 Tax=Myotis daubentonii TaxID=98922 RepID=UPI002873713B|nr:urocortin-2-like isoform X3 [Myotis daubentonii]
MPGWAMVLLVLALGSVPLASGTPVPAPQLPPQHSPQATRRPAASESPPRSPPASPGPRPGPRITLSLDVPLGLQQILLAQARARALREQAAANAHILAHVGR